MPLDSRQSAEIDAAVEASCEMMEDDRKGARLLLASAIRQLPHSRDARLRHRSHDEREGLTDLTGALRELSRRTFPDAHSVDSVAVTPRPDPTPLARVIPPPEPPAAIRVGGRVSSPDMLSAWGAGDEVRG